MKEELALKYDLTLESVFSLFSNYNSLRITASDILYGFERLGLIFDIADVKLLLDRYDQDRDGRLGFWEFSNIMLPLNPRLREDLERRKSRSGN